MITIKNIEDIEKYKSKEYYSRDENVYKELIYEFTENGELTDVVFDVEVPYSTERLWASDILINNYYFIANNITFNQGGGCHIVNCENLVAKGWCAIDEILALDNVDMGDGLCCQTIYARNIKCVGDMYVERDIHCEHLQVTDECILGKYIFQKGIDVDMIAGYGLPKSDLGKIRLTGYYPF